MKKPKPLMAWGVYSPTLGVFDDAWRADPTRKVCRHHARICNTAKCRYVADWRPVRVKISIAGPRKAAKKRSARR